MLDKNEKVNHNNYLELLCDHLPDCFDLTGAKIFQQDGASAHTARSVVQLLCDCEVNWPQNSPNLNLIENLWYLIKRDLRGKGTTSCV